MDKINLRWTELGVPGVASLIHEVEGYHNENINATTGFCMFSKNDFQKEKLISLISINYGNVKDIFEKNIRIHDKGYFCYANYEGSDYNKILCQLEYDLQPYNKTMNVENHGLEVQKPSHEKVFSNLESKKLCFNKNKFKRHSLVSFALIENVRLSFFDGYSKEDFLYISYLRWENEKLDLIKRRLNEIIGIEENVIIRSVKFRGNRIPDIDTFIN